MNQKSVHRTIDHIFKELMPVQGMAERPEQIALSHRMLNTMLNGGIALCDAGTGIGKTYAYLVAGIAFLRLRAEKRLPFQPILISTSSIALQNAVLNEYIPFLSELMLADGMSDHPIRAVVRKGKRHYVCDERLERRLRQVDLKKKNKAAANALASLLVDLDVDQAERLSGYDRERVCVPSCCDCHRSACRYQKILPAMIDYYETKEFIFTHGWIPCVADGNGGLAYIGDWRDAPRQMWRQARWLNGMDAVRMVSEEGKTIVCGHWHTSYGHSKYEGKGSEFGMDADFSPYSASGIIALDACTARSGIVNCIVVEDDELQ